MVWEVLQPGPFLNGLVPTVGGYQLSDQDCVIFSGAYPVMRHIQLHHTWTPGGWCTTENFSCAAYYPHFGRHLLNESHAILAIDDALSRLDELFVRFAKEDEIFVRPTGVQKTFTGRCEDREGFVLTLQSACYANEPVLVASPRELFEEWRVVIGRGRFVAASQYKSEGTHRELPGCPQEVRIYVERLLSEIPYRPDPIYMMDIGRSGTDLRVIELNSFSCSGLYQCDPAAVVSEVKNVALDAWRCAKGDSLKDGI